LRMTSGGAGLTVSSAAASLANETEVSAAPSM
jgi:hypothetical protein